MKRASVILIDGITRLKSDFIYSSFVATADYNYGAARLCFINGFPLEFFWNSMHCIEKYLKAIILLNGGSTKHIRKGHNIQDLFENVKQLDNRIEIPHFNIPKRDNDLMSGSESVASFLRRINELGSSHNRYLYYGYALTPDLLSKLDHCVWWIRRLCVIFKPKHEEIPESTDMVEVLINKNVKHWKIFDGLPLERWIKESTYEFPPQQSFAVMEANFMFNENASHLVTQRVLTSQGAYWSAISRIKELTKKLEENGPLSQEDNSTLKLCKDSIKWAIENIIFSKEDENALKSLLK